MEYPVSQPQKTGCAEIVVMMRAIAKANRFTGLDLPMLDGVPARLFPLLPCIVLSLAAEAWSITRDALFDLSTLISTTTRVSLFDSDCLFAILPIESPLAGFDRRKGLSNAMSDLFLCSDCDLAHSFATAKHRPTN